MFKRIKMEVKVVTTVALSYLESTDQIKNVSTSSKWIPFYAYLGNVLIMSIIKITIFFYLYYSL